MKFLDHLRELYWSLAGKAQAIDDFFGGGGKFQSPHGDKKDRTIQDMIEALSDKLWGWLTSLVLGLPNFLIGVLVFALFIWGARYVNRGISRLGGRLMKNPIAGRMMGSFGYVLFIIFGLLLALSALNLDGPVRGLLAGAGIFTLAISFAFQNISANFLSGYILTLRRPYEAGDWIQTNDIYAKVEALTLNYTRMITEHGQLVTMPNKLVLEGPLYNFSRLGRREVELHVGISYTDDLDRVKAIVEKTISDLPVRLADYPIEVNYTAYGDSAIDMEVAYWAPFQMHRDHERAVSEGILAIRRVFREENIVIPYPIRSMEMFDMSKPDIFKARS